jgi:hypothetical protein
MAEADWVSATGGSWTDPSNWLIGGTNAVPGAGDDAVIATTGNYRVEVRAAIGVGSIALSDTDATVAIVNVPGTVAVAQDVTIDGVLSVDGDPFTSEGGSTVVIGGTLTDAGRVTIGPQTGGLGAPTSVTVTALVNTGEIDLTGNTTGTPANTATLYVGSAAGFGTLGVLTGNVYLNGMANLEFATGQIGTIADGARFNLFGAALLSNASGTTTNSALSGLSSIAGIFDLADGETLAVGNDLSITSTGRLYVDGDSFTAEGGSTVDVNGTLNNAGFLTIGPQTGALGAPTRVTVNALVNTGEIDLTGNENGTPANTATLYVGSAAGFGTQGVLSGNVYLNGTANLEFASGGIGTIADGAQLNLFGASLLSNASGTTSNSALTGLASIAGAVHLANDETLAVGNDLSITSTGRLYVDGDAYTSEGGSTVDVNGTLNNAGFLIIGPETGGLGAPTRVTVNALVNTGEIDLTGNENGTPANTATLYVGSAAGFGTQGVLTGVVNLDGPANLEFATGQIGTIADGARLNLLTPRGCRTRPARRRTAL